MAHISPQKRLAKTAGFIRLATRQIQDRTPDLALKTLNNAANEIKVLLKDPKTDELTDIVTTLIQWHESKMEGIDKLVTDAGKSIDLGNGQSMQLKPDEIPPFRLGATFAKILISDSPLQVIKETESCADIIQAVEMTFYWPKNWERMIYGRYQADLQVNKTTEGAENDDE